MKRMGRREVGRRKTGEGGGESLDLRDANLIKGVLHCEFIATWVIGKHKHTHTFKTPLCPWHTPLQFAACLHLASSANMKSLPLSPVVQHPHLHPSIRKVGRALEDPLQVRHP